MNLIKYLKKKWQSFNKGYQFIKLVEAPYGDFKAIGRLSKLINSRENLQKVVEFLSSSEQGRLALQEHHRLGSIDLHQLHELPSNTFGYCYAKHMNERGLIPPSVPETVDHSSFPGVHLLETHDIWHVVTGCDTTKAGEIELEAFYLAQIYPSPTFLALLAKNLMKTAIEDLELCEEHMNALAKGWMRGKQAQPLFGVQWNTMWEVPLEQIQTQFNLNQPLEQSSQKVRFASVSQS